VHHENSLAGYPTDNAVIDRVVDAVSERGRRTRAPTYRSSQQLDNAFEGDVAMKDQQLDVLRGSGNVYRDLGQDNADVKQFKALLAAEIIKTLDRESLSVRRAQARTGIAAADFSRIRNADLGRFTLDRLVGIINRLGSRVEVKLKVKRAT
jgi:predicted XRE-type DNA-binding protein